MKNIFKTMNINNKIKLFVVVSLIIVTIPLLSLADIGDGVWGLGGVYQNQQSVTRSCTVNVTNGELPPDPNEYTYPRASITCNPTDINPGDSVEVRWYCGNGSTSTGEGANSDGTTGVYTKNPNTDTTYSVTCTKTVGNQTYSSTASCFVSTGGAPNGGGSYTTGGGAYGNPQNSWGGASKVPFVDIKANPMLVRPGQKSMVTWATRNAKNCVVTGPGIESNEWNGSKEVAIIQESTYTISCDGDLTDSVTVKILPIWKER